MLYDMAYKRACRLVRRNFQACCREAHALAALGLTIGVGQERIEISSSRDWNEEIVAVDRYGLITLGYAHSSTSWIEGSVEDVARVLQAALEHMNGAADTLGRVAKILAEAATPSE